MLTKSDFKNIASGGFGDRTTRIVQAMAWFDGALYVGTGGRSLNPLGLSDAAMAELGPFARAALANTGAPSGASIWRYTPDDGQWAKVFQAPEMEHQGKMVPRDRNVRASLVRTEEDGRPAAYFGISAMKGRVHIVRTFDGVTFEEGETSGLGLPEGSDVPSVRTLIEAEGHVFSSPVGMIEGRGMLDDNMSAFPQVFRADHPFSDTWDAVSAPGFGDPDNLSVNEMAVLDGFVYAGTLNIRTGCQMWRCPLDDLRPEAWQKVFDQGAGMGPPASIAAAMYTFDGHVYVATGLQRQGKQGIDRYGPVAGELLRVAADGTWQIVCGTNRLTDQGWKAPISGYGPAFGLPTARGIWHLADHDGLLYAGGADWRIFDTYIPPETSRLPPEEVQAIQARHDAYQGGFPMWCSADGETWSEVTLDGFDRNPETGGARFLQSSEQGLFLGTASTGSTPEHGGLQIWQGSTT